MSLIDQFHAGGFFMYFILLFGLLSLAVIAERFWSLYIKTKATPKDFRKKVLAFISHGDYQGAEDFINSHPKKSEVMKVAEVGIKMRKSLAGDEALQARMDEQLTKEVNAVDKRTGFLAMFGNVATLFGLLGTVTGLISSFAGVASASPVERANLLSQGISEALNSTAFGLLAAIPALVAFAIFQNKTESIVNGLTEESSELYHDFLFYSDNDAQDIAASSAINTNEKITDIDAQNMTRN